MKQAKQTTTMMWLLLGAAAGLAGCGGRTTDETATKTSEIVQMPQCDRCLADPTASGCPEDGNAEEDITCSGPWEVTHNSECMGRFDQCECEVHPKVWRDFDEHANISQRVDATGFYQVCISTGEPPDCRGEGNTCYCETREEPMLSYQVAEQKCNQLLYSQVAQTESHFGGVGQPPANLRWGTRSTSLSDPQGDTSSGFTYRCGVTARYTVARLVDDTDQCTLRKECSWHHPSCGSSTTFDHAGSTRRDVLASVCPNGDQNGCEEGLNAQCVTAEQITPTKARFDAVSARLDSDLTAAEAADPGIREKLSTILQMIYEFDWATLSEPQRGRALQSYEAAPNPVQCGAMVDPSILGQCQSTDWMLQYCARMTGEHVSPDLIWSRAMHDSGAFNGSVADFCFNVLAEMDAASCRMENAITEAFDVDRALLRKAGVGFEEALPQCLGPEGEGRLERIAATSTMFEFVQQWHNTVVTAAQKAGNGITELRLDDELTGALGDMWTAVDKRLDLSGELARSSNVDGGHLTCGRETSLGLVDMFEAATQRSIEVDQDVLLAATGALEGAPLLAALGHITQAQIGRLDAQRVSHDLACKFTGCGAGSATAQTRVAYLYRLISLLDRPDDGQSPDPAQGIFEDLSEALQDPSRPSTEWWSTFNQLQPNQQRIVDALGTYTPNGYSPEAFRALTMGDLLRSARPFVDAIRRSKRRYDNYINAGSLTPRIGRYLRTPVNHERRGEVEFLLQRYANALEVDVQSFESNMQTILSALPTITQNAQTEARLVVELDRISRELDRIDERRDAHATGAYRSGVDEQIGQAWIDVNGMLESGGVPTQFIEIDQVPGVGDPPIQVSGASAPRNRRGSITQLAVPWNGGVASISANPGEILVVEVPSQDQYSPKCVIEALHPQDGCSVWSARRRPLVAPLTGPAGYTLSESNSTYSAKSISDHCSPRRPAFALRFA